MSGVADNTLTQIAIPKTFTPSGGTALNVIGISENAFSGCSALSDIWISDSITEIGNNAFAGCSALKKLYFNNAVISTIGSGNFTSEMEIYAKNATTISTLKALSPNAIAVELNFSIDRSSNGTGGGGPNSASNSFKYILTIGTKEYVYEYDFLMGFRSVIDKTLIIFPETSNALNVTLKTHIEANSIMSGNEGIDGIQEKIAFSSKNSNGSLTRIFGTGTGASDFNTYTDSFAEATYPVKGSTATVTPGSDYKLTIDYTVMERVKCFTEDTLVTLADGTTKMIKDVTYDDLLMVYDFDRGEFAVSYPVWIATAGEYSSYYLAEFDDGSSIKIVINHRLFSDTTLDYSRVIDAELSCVGKSFIRQVMGEDGKPKLVSVKCTNITIVEEQCTYYNMVTSQALNFISNGFIGATGVGNMYTFTKIDDQTYVHNQDQLSHTKGGSDDVDNGTRFAYEQFDTSIVPYYIYVAYRLSETRNMVNILLNTEPYKSMVEQYEAAGKDGKKIVTQLALTIISDYFKSDYEDDPTANLSSFKVTFSDRDYDGKRYESESEYVLPDPVESENFIGWYNTFDGKIYQSGEVAKLYMNTHFIARYEESA